jgi:hypothetical protein
MQVVLGTKIGGEGWSQAPLAQSPKKQLTINEGISWDCYSGQLLADS